MPRWLPCETEAEAQMPGMKVTVDAAMRARDVSRPHAEHEALADEREPTSAEAPEHGQGALPPGSAGALSDTPARDAAPGGPPKGRSPRRRRRRR